MRALKRFIAGGFVGGIVRLAWICGWIGWLALPVAGWGHGGFHDRIRELTAALKLNPLDARLHFELADIYWQHGEWENSLRELERVEALAPAQYPTDLVRGQALLVGEKYDEALVALDRFIAAHPAHEQALLARARVQRGLGREEPCLADFAAALRASPEPHPEIFAEAADFQAASGRREAAVKLLNTALAECGPDPTLLRRALALELELERFDDALGRVDALQKMAPRPEPWMAQRAEILARAGRAAESRAAWESLAKHLAALPNLERGSPPMRALAEKARAALNAPAPGAND